MTVYRPPPDTGLSVIHADDFIVVVDKPSGLLSVPGRGPDKADCLVARVQVRFPDALAVHRLDMDTSGLMVLALDPEAQRRLSADFEARRDQSFWTGLRAALPLWDERIEEFNRLASGEEI